MRLDLDEPFNEVIFDGFSWYWYFENSWLGSVNLWRFLRDGRVQYVSSDQGARFGLGHPLDLMGPRQDALGGRRVVGIDIDDQTGDLVLDFGDGVRIQVLISSGGYESYMLLANGNQYIGYGAKGAEMIDWDGRLPDRISIED